MLKNGILAIVRIKRSFFTGEKDKCRIKKYYSR